MLYNIKKSYFWDFRSPSGRAGINPSLQIKWFSDATRQKNVGNRFFVSLKDQQYQIETVPSILYHF